MAEIDHAVIERLLMGDKVKATAAERREVVAYLIRRGYSHARIAARLHISERTVDRLRAGI